MSSITIDKEKLKTFILLQYTSGYDEGQQDLKACILGALEVTNSAFPTTLMTIKEVIQMIKETKVTEK